MSEDSGPWWEGKQAWDRLEAWCRDTPSAPPSHPDDGDRALEALADGGLVRRTLDQIEFEAVRTARKHGKSWAEIAVRLGVTRQSAWERWRDVDDAASPAPAPSAEPESPREHGKVFKAAASAIVQRMMSEPTAGPEEVSEPARSWRKRSSVAVPDVVKMTVADAHVALQRRGLVAVGPDLDGVPLDLVGQADDVVTDQSPEAGAKVPPGSAVVLWSERRGGGSGVREPRRPLPDPKTGRMMQDETTGEAVS